MHGVAQFQQVFRRFATAIRDLRLRLKAASFVNLRKAALDGRMRTTAREDRSIPDARILLKQEFKLFEGTTIEILQGDILQPEEVLKPEVDVEALVSTDDNYLTMGDGIAARLRENAATDESNKYILEAQRQCPVTAGSVVVTDPYELVKLYPKVEKVLHGTVIDYDTEDLHLEELVYQATSNCLKEAEKKGLKRILFPAFAAGAGMLPMDKCAHQMCSAIKAYLAQKHPLEAIYIILHLSADPEDRKRHEDRNSQFIAEANLVLGVPYNPTLNIRQTREFYGRAVELRLVEEVITGEVNGKRSVVILGGPRMGKCALLDKFFEKSQTSGGALSQGRHFVRVTFGRVQQNTPPSFIYRKLLCALSQSIEDEGIKREIKDAYADPGMDHERFLNFLKERSDRYPQIVFLVDHLPQLLDMEGEGKDIYEAFKTFWDSLDKLEEHVRFVCTSRDDTQYQHLLDRLSYRFKDQLEVVRLTCVSEDDRQNWVDQLYQRHLERDATSHEHQFFEQEAGQHPYLISLAGYTLIEAIKRDAIRSREHHPKRYTEQSLAPFFREARQAIGEPRRAFFDHLMHSLDSEHRTELRILAEAVAIEEEREELVGDLLSRDPNAKRRLQELQEMMDPRDYLHRKTLLELEAWGYVVSANQEEAVEPKAANFMAKPFWLYVQEYFRTRRRTQEMDQPKDLVISLLSAYQESTVPGKAGVTPSDSTGHEAEMIWTMCRSRGARIPTAQQPLPPKFKEEFKSSFSQLINSQLHPAKGLDPGVFRNLEDVGNYILTQFTTAEIKRYLQDLPQGSTILLALDDALKDIPWELMLETAYAGEIPFRVGRIIVGPRQPHLMSRPAGRDDNIKALLIGDPEDNLEIAQREVRWLAERLQRADRFADPDVLIGPKECQRIPLLSRLGSGEYGLIHFSGHTRFDGERSAWVLEDGDITTDKLTNALQMAPPALVFSSSCESAKASESKEIKYEDQTFDLPSAFLQAGVEAYIGTLWEVLEQPAERFVQEFYSALLSAEYDLGECMRRAKWACKKCGQWQDRIHWLAFVLYGDPHAKPGDLFPVLRRQGK